MRGRCARTLLALTAILLAGLVPAQADADADWAVIVKLDAGPPNLPASRDEAIRIAREHFAKQRAVLQAFVATYPGDPRVLDATLRLISIRATLGKMESKPAEVQAALLELMALEKSKDVPRARQPDVAFRRISLQMQSLEGRPGEIRETVVIAARNFSIKFPEDKRAPRLLVEAATQCDEDPRTMRDLLTSAQMLSKEPSLNARIADDMRRLNALGKPVNLKFPTIQGGSVDIAALRGNVVVVLFWAAQSPPSLLWMEKFRAAIAAIPPEGLRIVMVSLDEDRKDLDEALRMFSVKWPVNYDGKGWENAVARPLGINAIPTVWVIDRKGVLRTLNARESYDTWIRRLQLEH